MEQDLTLEAAKSLSNKLPTEKEYKRLQDDLRIAQLQLQEANDTLNGGITNRNMGWIRQTYVVNDSDSLDDTYPMYVHFRILDETLKVVSVKVSYWIGKYRAYSTAAVEAAATSSGASSSTSSGASSKSTADSGGAVSSASNGFDHYHEINVYYDGGGNKSLNLFYDSGTPNNSYIVTDGLAYGESLKLKTTAPSRTHTHIGGLHSHGMEHTHNIEHTHSIPAHSHDVAYGIFEEDTTPTIRFSVSEDDGSTYSKTFGNVAVNLEQVDITDSITRLGSKLLKMESSTRCRLTVQVEVKVDISVR